MHSSICDYCKRKWPQGYRCDAFPGETGIPYEIVTDQFDHRFPYSGDHGVQFQLDTSLEPPVWEPAELLKRLAAASSPPATGAGPATGVP
jgi:hypothetical protein